MRELHTGDPECHEWSGGKSLQTMGIRSSTPNRPEAKVEVQLNSPFFCVSTVDARRRACTIAAHAGRPPEQPRQVSIGRAGARALSYAENGRSEAGERDPDPAGPPPARS